MIQIIVMMKIIAEHYEGGKNKFMMDHGALCFVPGPDLIYIIHPALPEVIRKKFIKEFGVENVVFGSTWNFEGCTEENYAEINKSLEEVLNELKVGNIGTVVNPCVLGITIPLSKKDPKIKDLIEVVSYLSKLQRGCVLCTDGHILFEGKAPHEEVVSNKGGVPAFIPVQTDKPARLKAINEDDITNLIIAMESSKSLEEFLSHV